MTDPQEEQPQDAGEQRKERVAISCLTAIGVTFAGTLAITVPETAYYTAGLLTAASVRRARTWVARRRHDDEEQAEPVDIVAVLLTLSQGEENVRLTQLQEAAGLPDTKAVRALLDEAGIPIRTGVRAGGKNGPGVHADDIPREATTPSGGCLCRSDANTNANNATEEGSEKGFRVEHTGQAGTTIYDLSETQHRHHKLTGARRG